MISSELPVGEPGRFQIDLVGPDGGNPNGYFAFSLNAVELYSGWVEPRILLNKARRWVKKAVQSVKTTTVLTIKSLHSDNDSAFINEPLQAWCRLEGSAFSGGRPYHSNDTCDVEQKNCNIVREALGYWTDHHRRACSPRGDRDSLRSPMLPALELGSCAEQKMSIDYAIDYAIPGSVRNTVTLMCEVTGVCSNDLLELITNTW